MAVSLWKQSSILWVLWWLLTGGCDNTATSIIFKNLNLCIKMISLPYKTTSNLPNRKKLKWTFYLVELLLVISFWEIHI